MKYLGSTTESHDIATKNYADTHGPSGGGGGGGSYDDSALWDAIDNTLKPSLAGKIEKINVSAYTSYLDLEVFTDKTGSPTHVTIPAAGEKAGVVTAAQAARLPFLCDPKLEIFSGSSSTTNIHEINSDTDVILCTYTSASSYLRLPKNAPNGKRIIAKCLGGSTQRTITIYPSSDTDGKKVVLIGYSSTSSTTGASTVACSYYPTEFLCLIDGNTRYWLQVSRY